MVEAAANRVGNAEPDVVSSDCPLAALQLEQKKGRRVYQMMQKRKTSEVGAQVAMFAEHCRKSGISVTRQRLAIFEALAASREHPSAEKIHRTVRRRLPHLSLATVYKNLESLREIGAVSDVNALHEHGRYEAALPGTGAGRPHHHLVCISCRKVVDLYDEALNTVRVSDTLGFQVRALKVQVEGICPDCAARARRG